MFALILFLPNETRSQWTQLPQAFGSAINSFAYTVENESGSLKTNILVGTNDGIFRSRDQGVSWNIADTGLTNTKVNSLLQLGTNILAGTARGVFRTTDNGSNWTGAGLSGYFVNGLVKSNGNIFAETHDGIFISTDSSKNWSAFAMTDSVINCLAFSHGNIFTGTDNGFFISTDNSANWTAADSALPNKHINSISVYNYYTYAGTNGGLFVSPDNGKSWSSIPLGGLNSRINCSAVLDGSILAGTVTGIWTNFDDFLNVYNEREWVPAGLEGNINSLVITVSDTDNSKVTGIFAGTSDVFFTNDFSMSGGFDLKNLGLRYVASLAASSNNIFAGTHGGVFFSADDGTSWTAEDSGLTDTYVNYVLLAGQNIYAGTNEGVFRSSSNHINWVSLGLTDKPIDCIAVRSTNIFAGTNNTIFLTNDGGKNWIEADSGLTESGIHSLAVLDSSVFAATNDGVFISIDGGKSWASAGLKDTSINCLAVSGNTIFADAHYSTDNGLNWENMYGNGAYIVSLAAVSDTNVFAGVPIGGVRLLRTDPYVAYTPDLYALPDSFMTAVAVNNKYLFAAGNDGEFTAGHVWRIPLSDIITGINNRRNNSPSGFSLEQNYPNPFNPSTVIRFRLPASLNVTLKIYDLLGNKVRTLLNKRETAGMHEVVFDASGLASGVYFYQLKATDHSNKLHGFISAKKMILIR